MPTYDYFCLDCRRRFELILSYAEYGSRAAACPHCDSLNVRRRPPRVRLLRGEEASLESLADPEKLNGLENDPRAMAKMFREMGKSSGEGLPPQFDEIVDRLDAGQSPEQIESALPEIGGADDSLAGGE